MRKIDFKKKIGFHSCPTKHGCLSKCDIIYEIEQNSLIITPLAEGKDKYKNIKYASFDISPSCLIMSVKQGRFVRIYSEITRCTKGYKLPEWHCKNCPYLNDKENSLSCTEQKYIYIAPKDTVLILSKEYLQLPNYISGNVFSRVSTVSAGLGHIATTIDPLWKGALLIAISNPSSEPIKLLIEDVNASSIPLATVTLQYLNTPIKTDDNENPHLPARVDILEKYLHNTKNTKSRFELIKSTIFRLIHIKDYNLSVNLINRLKSCSNISPSEWVNTLSELEKEVCAQKIQEKKWQKLRPFLIKLLKICLPIIIFITFFVTAAPYLDGKQVPLNEFILPIFLLLIEFILNIISEKN